MNTVHLPAEIPSPDEPALSAEAALWGLALLLGLGLRLLNLGASPLSESEAAWALQALHPANGIGSQPGYVQISGLIFALFGATELTARLFPALSGAALVWLPVLLRRGLGRPAALVLAFGLALDPGLVTISRQAGGPMPALAAGLLAVGLWQAGRAGPGWQPALAGALAGLALLCGPTAWFGLLAGGLGWAALRLFARQAPAAPSIAAPQPPPEPEGPDLAETAPAEVEADPAGAARISPAARAALVGGLASFLLIGSGLFSRPQGLAAALGALPDFLAAWVRPAAAPAGQMLGLLLVYAPLALIFAGVALARWLEARLLQAPGAVEPPATPRLWVYFAAAALLALLYPGRQPGDLAWALVPLWGAAAIGLAAYLPVELPHPIAATQAGLTFVMAALLGLWLASSEVLIPANAQVWWGLRPAIVIGILALSALTTALVALGWRWEYARDGLVWGLTAALAVYATAALWGAAYLRPNQPQELWGRPPAPGQVDLLRATLAQLSNRERGLPTQAEIVSLVDTASLRWALRAYSQARFVASLPGDPGQPALVITRQQDQLPALSAGYRGQDFVWWVRPGWEGGLPPNLILWLAYRQAPLMNESLIVWARNDLFP